MRDEAQTKMVINMRYIMSLAALALTSPSRRGNFPLNVSQEDG